MKTDLFTSLLRRCSLLILLVAAAVAARGETVPIDLSGDYDDEGVLFAGGAEKFKGVISLRALLSLEFDPVRAQELHEETAWVRLTQKNGELEIQAGDSTDKVRRLGRWAEGADYGQQDKQVVLRLRSKTEVCVLNFEIVGEERLLQLTVLRGKATVFGPMGQPVGTFLFARRAAQP